MAHSVLLIDDCDEISVPLKFLMERMGIETVVAHNGAEALHLLKTKNFSLILLDLNMPQMSGAEFLREKTALGNVTPVVILSADVPDPRLNIQGVLAKPFRFRDVVGVVKEMLAKGA